MVDFFVRPHGESITLEARSDRAKEWCNEHLTNGKTWPCTSGGYLIFSGEMIRWIGNKLFDESLTYEDAKEGQTYENVKVTAA